MDEIHGERISICRTTINDLPDLMALWNDGRVMRWVGYPDGLGYDREDVEKWFYWIQASPVRRHFVVHAAGIGFCGELYYKADRVHRRAELDIKLIPEAQGQGIATEALKGLIRIVFESEPEINAVWTEPSEENQAARRLYGRCGLEPKLRPADMLPGYSYWELRREDWKDGWKES